MAKSRLINTHFWNDNYICNLDPIEKLLFLYFLTNQNTNIAGVYEINLKQVSLDTGIDREMVLKILSRFESEKKIFYFEGFIISSNFIKHQNQQSEKIKSGIENILAELPEKVKKFISKQIKGYPYPFTFNIIKSNIIKSNSIQSNTKNGKEGFEKLKEDKNQEPGKETTLDNPELRFNKFWKFYSRREGDDKKIRELFRKEIVSEKDFENLIKSVRNYRDLTANRPLEYVMLPITFLKKYKNYIDVS